MEISQTSLLGAGATSKAEQSAIGLADNFDSFLQLLTQQLQNQDPLEPLNSTEFTAQLVQFATVEQNVNQNLTLEKMLEVQQANQAVSATGFLGAQVEVFGDQLDFKGEPVKFGYELAADASELTVNIKNAAGAIVRTLEGELGSGAHKLVWDGQNENGLEVAPGLYTIDVIARDAAGERIDASTTVSGVVDSVAARDGSVVINIGAASFPVSDVVSVSAAGGAGDATDDTTDTNA